MAEKFALQCATQVAGGGFPVAVGRRRAIELTRATGRGATAIFSSIRVADADELNQ
jgi:hypothetical protein